MSGPIVVSADGVLTILLELIRVDRSRRTYQNTQKRFWNHKIILKMNFVNQRADLSYSTEVIEQIGDPPIVSADTITRQVTF